MNKPIWCFWGLLMPAYLLLPAIADDAPYYHTVDAEVRMEGRSDKEEKWQYRLRYYPTITLTDDDSLSVNGLITTGSGFNSTHNSLDGSAEPIYLRRLFLRKSYGKGKTEIGVLPTYKGSISLSGLSKDGWIKGIRQVVQQDEDSAFELVVGNLENLDAAHALDFPDELNYFELEYSTALDDGQSMEASIERMLSGNFIRLEYKYDLGEEHAGTIEWVQRIDDSQTKMVAGFTGELDTRVGLLGYATYYSYTSEGFGPRGTLTEEFIDTGHGYSLDFFGTLSGVPNTSWFLGYDTVDGTHRVQIGINVFLD